MKGVIFDMDGVLCDSEPFICEAAVEMFRRQHGIMVKPEDFIPFVGTGENRYLGGVAEKYGVALDIARDKKTTYDMYLELIRGRLSAFPGVKQFTTDCRRRGLKMAVATSADKVKLDGNLREMGMSAGTFDATVNGLEVDRKKPFPDIFITAAGRIGLSASECLVIEDAPSGIKAGKAAGARCLGITSSFDKQVLLSAGADWIAAGLDQVPDGIWEW